MIDPEDFEAVHQEYSKAFGHTFTTFGRSPENPDYAIAYNLMLQCLSGERTEPVTDDAIGVEGEGIRTQP